MYVATYVATYLDTYIPTYLDRYLSNRPHIYTYIYTQEKIYRYRYLRTNHSYTRNSINYSLLLSLTQTYLYLLHSYL